VFAEAEVAVERADEVFVGGGSGADEREDEECTLHRAAAHGARSGGLPPAGLGAGRELEQKQ